MTETWRVLLVEDSATDAKLVVRELQRSGRTIEFERVDAADAMREALARGPWDVVLSDSSMPTFSAAAALEILKEHSEDIPFILVSGTIGEEKAVEAMRRGAADFVLKDKLTRLTPAVERELRDARVRAARRAAEVALLEAERRFRRLAESGVIGIVTSDLTGRILEANDAYVTMIGYSRDELLGGEVTWPDVTPPEFRDQAKAAVQMLLRAGVAPPWETEGLRKDGRRVPMLVGVAMLEHPRCIAFVVDLSDRRRAEEGRAAAEKALLASEQQLRHAQKMEALGRLAGGVAHDFNNVLSVVLGYSALLLDDLPPTDPVRADIEEISKASSRGASLTRQLLMFSRQEVVEPRVLDLHAVVTGVETMLRRILGEDVELSIVAPREPGRVRADPTQIEQVILNLAVNARDAMPTGGRLRIETANVALDATDAIQGQPVSPGPYVMLAVTDTGSGMDARTQSRIFEPFFTTKEGGKGTGLGLSIVFGIVRQNAGGIWVSSEPGLGTTFTIYLPRVDADSVAAGQTVRPASPRGSETILLVEDEDAVRTITSHVLRRQGYEVIQARHGAEALRLSEEHDGPIDLVITDVVMPQMGGPELAKRLAALRPGIKSLCISGYTDDSVVRHGVLETQVAFLQKPIAPDTLAAKVREVLDETPAPRGRDPDRA